MNAFGIKKMSGLLVLMCMPLFSQAEESGSAPSWLPFAAVFRAEKQDVMKRAMTGTQSIFYVEYLKKPEDPERLRRMADLYFHLGDYPRAARWYFRVLQLKPDDREAPVWFAESLYHAEGVEPALQVLEALAEHGQDTRITRTLRAEIYFVTEKYEAARALLEQILEDTKEQAENQEMALLREVITRNLRVVRAAIASTKTKVKNSELEGVESPAPLKPIEEESN